MMIFWLLTVIFAVDQVQGVNNTTTDVPSDIPEGSIRLVDGSYSFEGRIEIYQDGEWGTICDDYWEHEEGYVVCRQLGYHGVDRVFSDDYFGEGSGPIWIRGLFCTGYESTLNECDQYTWAYPTCGHDQDIGIRCLDGGFNSGDVRLTGGAGTYEGLVEIYRGTAWGVSADPSFGYDEASVVCRQLGFQDGVAEYYATNAPFDEQSATFDAFFISSLDCQGNEGNIKDCYIGYDGLYLDQFNGVVCKYDEASTYNGKVRLTEGDGSAHGRLEIYLENEWGTICEDRTFGYDEAFVVCRSLGYPDVVEFGEDDVVPYDGPPGSGKVYLQHLDCDGKESSILYCDSRQFINYNCDYSEGITIRCENPSGSPDLVVYFLIGGGVIVFVILSVVCCVKTCNKASSRSSPPTNPIDIHSQATGASGSGQIPLHSTTMYMPYQAADVTGQTQYPYGQHYGSHAPTQQVFNPAGGITPGAPLDSNPPRYPVPGSHPFTVYSPATTGDVAPGPAFAGVTDPADHYPTTPAPPYHLVQQWGNSPVVPPIPLGSTNPLSPSGAQGLTSTLPSTEQGGTETRDEAPIYYSPAPPIAQPGEAHPVFTLPHNRN